MTMTLSRLQSRRKLTSDMVHVSLIFPVLQTIYCYIGTSEFTYQKVKKKRKRVNILLSIKHSQLSAPKP